MNSIPSTFPFQVSDVFVTLLGAIADLIIQVEMRFARRLDVDRLARACRMALDAEPILGCRVVYHPRRPWWQRLDKNAFDNFRLAQNEAEFDAFRGESLDQYTGPQVKVCLWHAPDEDRLLVKVSHVVADAGGTKETVRLISGIYRRLQSEPDFVPEPNITGRRSLMQVINHVPWTAMPRLYRRYVREVWRNTVPKGTHSITLPDGPREPVSYVRHHLPSQRVNALADYGRVRGATLNDMMIAAHLRALCTIKEKVDGTQLRLGGTVDLRRYLPGERGEAIANLSGLEFILYGPYLGQTFDETLAVVLKQTTYTKTFYIGLNNYVGTAPLVKILPLETSKKVFEAALNKGMREGNLAAALTNMGPIKTPDVTFDEPPLDAWLLPPPGYPPSVLSGLTGYEGSLSLSSAVYPNSRELMSRILNATVESLPL